jgi:hypothetical protein
MAGRPIREVREDDLPRLARLVAACGFPERSVAGWRWVLFGNPVQQDTPPGWVMEDQAGGLAGFIGNYIMTYRRGDRRFRFAMGHTMVSDLEDPGRHTSLRLVRHGLRQTGIDAYLALNCNALSARVLPRFRAGAWLGAEGREWIEWPTAPGRILGSRLSRLAARVRKQGEPVLRTGRPGFDRPAELDRGITVMPVEAVPDAGIESLARRLAAEDRIVRDITPQLLAHRRADPDRADGYWQVVVEAGGEPVLLAALLLTKPSAEGLEHLEIADWIAVSGEAAERAQAALLRHVVRSARRAGLAKVRMHFPGLTGSRLRAGTGLRLRRWLDFDPCHGLFHSGAALKGWRAGPGDTDYFFAYRIPPGLYRGQPTP